MKNSPVRSSSCKGQIVCQPSKWRFQLVFVIILTFTVGGCRLLAWTSYTIQIFQKKKIPLKTVKLNLTRLCPVYYFQPYPYPTCPTLKVIFKEKARFLNTIFSGSSSKYGYFFQTGCWNWLGHTRTVMGFGNTETFLNRMSFGMNEWKS